MSPGTEIIKRVNRQYEEFLIYGGYPRIALADSPDEKMLVLKNIVNTYLLREIKQILNYRDDYKLTKLIHCITGEPSPALKWILFWKEKGSCYLLR